MADLRNRRNVLVGAPDVQASGGFTIGPVAKSGDEFPQTADALAELTREHGASGYISEDGVVKSVDRSTEKIKDWNGDTVLITQSDHSVTLQVTFLEAANAEVLKMVYGDSNVEDDGGVIKTVENADELPHRSNAFYIKGGNGGNIFVYAPDVQVTEVGEVNYVRSDVVKYQVTLECFGVDNQKLISFIQRAENDEVATAGGADGVEEGTGGAEENTGGANGAEEGTGETAQ